MTRSQLASLIVAEFAIAEQAMRVTRMNIVETDDGRVTVFGKLLGGMQDEAFLADLRERVNKAFTLSVEDIQQDLVNKLVESAMTDEEMQAYADFTQTHACQFIKDFILHNMTDMTTTILGYIEQYLAK